MTSDLLFRVLQVAVVAPWILKASSAPGNGPYFNIGLKLVAGTLIASNAPVLIEAYRLHYKAAVDAWLAQSGREGVTIDARTGRVVS